MEEIYLKIIFRMQKLQQKPQKCTVLKGFEKLNFEN